MRIFGHDFLHIDQAEITDLESLAREKAIYGDHWIDRLDDFRHVRIVLTDKEIAEYVRSMVAFDLFLGSSARWARDVAAIPPDIATRADSYSLLASEGKTVGPPWHCAADFLGEDLEEITCLDNPRVEVIEEQGIASFLSTIRRIVDALTPAIRSFGSREKGLNSWTISREDDVRDLLYVMLRGAISDIRREEPIPSRAGVSKVVDLFSRTAKTMIEVKWIPKESRWKEVLNEIHVDIQTYGRHPDCRNLIFVVVDAAKAVPDSRLVETELGGKQIIDRKSIDITAYIRET